MVCTTPVPYCTVTARGSLQGFIFHSNGLHPSKILETDNKTVMCDAKYQPPNKTAIQNNIQSTIKAQCYGPAHHTSSA